MSTVTAIAKTAKTYAKDLAERVVATFVVTVLGVILAAGPGDMFNVTLLQAAATAGLAAVGSLLKGLAARYVGDRNSASTAPGV